MANTGLSGTAYILGEETATKTGSAVSVIVPFVALAITLIM